LVEAPHCGPVGVMASFMAIEPDVSRSQRKMALRTWARASSSLRP